MSTRKFNLTIPSGQTLSNSYELGEDGARGPIAMALWTPFLQTTVTIETCGPLRNFCTLQSSGADIIIGSRRHTQVIVLCATAIQVRAAAPVEEDKIFEFVPNTVTDQRG
jgi:hypothetical protein